MPSNTLPCIEIETAADPTASIIWLHGLGADGNDFVPIVPELKLPATLAARFVFPNAPVRNVTINNGMAMRAWYDISSGNLATRVDIAGVQQSQVEINALIEREKSRGIAASRIVLAGFSQGGVIALHTALRYPERLCGVIALSTYLVLHDRLAEDAAPANRGLPIFMGHGNADPVVLFDWGASSQRALVAGGYPVEWHAYRMEHSVCMEEIQAIGAWLTKRLATTQ